MNVLSDSAIDRKNEKNEYTIYARRKQSFKEKTSTIQFILKFLYIDCRISIIKKTLHLSVKYIHDKGLHDKESGRAYSRYSFISHNKHNLDGII